MVFVDGACISPPFLNEGYIDGLCSADSGEPRLYYGRSEDRWGLSEFPYIVPLAALALVEGFPQGVIVDVDEHTRAARTFDGGLAVRRRCEIWSIIPVSTFSPEEYTEMKRFFPDNVLPEGWLSPAE